MAVDYHGKPLAKMNYFKTNNHIMLAHIPTKGVKTIYPFIGDAFAWVCIAILALMILLTYLLKRRTSEPQ